jgi:hypothetical protein
MALANYNGFPGEMRSASGAVQEQMWRDNMLLPHPQTLGCQVCFQTEGTIQGHCEDYTRLDVYMPLCVTCHLILHMRFSNPTLWEDYKTAIRHGWRGEPMTLRTAFGRIGKLYPQQLYVRDDLYVNDFRPSTYLDALSPVKIVHPNAPTDGKWSFEPALLPCEREL